MARSVLSQTSNSPLFQGGYRTRDCQREPHPIRKDHCKIVASIRVIDIDYYITRETESQQTISVFVHTNEEGNKVWPIFWLTSAT
jgi:hypothetical protein